MGIVVPSRGRSHQAKRWAWGLLLVLLSLPALAGKVPSENPHLRQALRLFDALEYDEALRMLDKAEQWPSNTAEDRASIALLEGVLSYETQQPVRGDRAFQRALEIDREAKLAWSVSPKVAARLEQLRAKQQSGQPASPLPEAAAPLPAPKAAGRMNLKLPVAIGGGVVALGGVLAWGQAKALEGKVRRADPSITTQSQLEDTLSQGRTLEKVGWGLMGLGAAATVGSLLFLEMPAEGAKAAISPVAQGAQLSVSWSLP